MKAIRIHPNSDTSNPYSASNPAPPSSLTLDDIATPKIKSGEILVNVKATTIVRDALTWPETYLTEYPTPGNDFAGIVVETSGDSAFKPGDEVFGMTDAARAGAWAEYAVVLENEAALKPKSLTWEQAAAIPLSGLTAYQAIFEKGNPSGKLLVTGANGGVGLYLIQIGKYAGMHVTGATRSNARNGELLKSLGADEVVEYKNLNDQYDVIVDTIGGDILKNCWSLIKETGTLISVESAAYDFVEEHRKLGLAKAKALWFVVSPSREGLEHLSTILNEKKFEVFVASVQPLANASHAYEGSQAGSAARGKIVLTP